MRGPDGKEGKKGMAAASLSRFRVSYSGADRNSSTWFYVDCINFNLDLGIEAFRARSWLDIYGSDWSDVHLVLSRNTSLLPTVRLAARRCRLAY